ncbi:MAG TPA: helix-turn-helix transcriptional regulator, partial [Chloroflexota bacterium]|nr:helix-turn-helix transcriptional regulator [Chloroflexota bacterium]
MRGGMGHGRGWRRIPWLQGPPWPAESGAPAEARPGGGPGAPPAGRRRPVVGTRFAEPFLLLLLAEGPSHGYDLLERLAGRGFVAGEVDAGYLYRTLRGMEEAGLVTSEWDSASRGPIKRTYAITP